MLPVIRELIIALLHSPQHSRNVLPINGVYMSWAHNVKLSTFIHIHGVCHMAKVGKSLLESLHVRSESSVRGDCQTENGWPRCTYTRSIKNTTFIIIQSWNDRGGVAKQTVVTHEGDVYLLREVCVDCQPQAPSSVEYLIQLQQYLYRRAFEYCLHH